MTEYTASDFAKAEFARHPDGRVAARTGVDWAQWAFKCSECETDEERNECDGHDFGPDGFMASSGWVPVQENPRPLTPDALTDETAAKIAKALGDLGHGWVPSHYMHDALILALTESPARPEGAERFDPVVDTAIRGHSDITSPDVVRAISDAIAEEMNR